MKLRNKKTGKVFDVIVREKSNGDGEYSIIVCNLRALRSARSVSSILGEYDSLAKFNEDWEDYKPIEPLIDDKDIRNRLKKWMEAIGISLDTCLTRMQSGDYGLIIECGDNRIAFRYYKKLLYRRKTRKTDLVTMRELIGEKE